MERKHLRFLWTLVLMAVVVTPLRGIEKPEWMKCLPDSLPLCKISIPGSHDSGTTKGGSMLQTQTVDIPRQLQKGIRAFDIRLEKKNDKLGIFHSYAFQDIYWEDDVLPAFIAFLQAHPSETLIVSLKREGGSRKITHLYCRLL